MWEELVAEYGDELEMVIVDRDEPEGRAFAESHGVRYQPGFVVVAPDGEVVYAALGPYDGDELRDLVESALEL